MLGTKANASTAKPYLPTTAVNDPNNARSFYETLLKKTFLENGEPSTVFMRL
jgi:hypothetical protein